MSTQLRESLRMYKTHIIFSCICFYLLSDDKTFVYLIAYAISASLIGAVLKLICWGLFKDQCRRPKGAHNCSGSYKYNSTVKSTRNSFPGMLGMPSGHSMGAFALATLASFYIYEKEQKENISTRTNGHINNMKTHFKMYAKIFFFFSLALMVALSRTKLVGTLSAGGHGNKATNVSCHSLLQITVGSLLGISQACIVRYTDLWKFFKP